MNENSSENEVIKPNSSFGMKVLKKILKSQLFFLAGIFFIILFYTLYFARDIIVPIIIAILLSFLLSPAVVALKKIYIPRPISAFFLILLSLVIFSYGSYSFIQPATAWINKGPETVSVVDVKLEKLSKFLGHPLKAISTVSEEISRFTKKVQIKEKVIPVKESYFMSTLFMTTWQFLLELSLTALFLYFFLVYEHFFLRKLVNLASDMKKKKDIVTIIYEVQDRVWKFLFARIAINVGLAIAISILMFILGMPDPIFWGTLVGLLNFIPYLGALISFVVIALVALVSFNSLGYAFLVMFLFTVTVFIEGYIVTPIVIGRAVMLNPIVVFIGIIFWGWLWGIAGTIIAAPLMVTIKIISETLYERSLVNELLSD